MHQDVILFILKIESLFYQFLKLICFHTSCIRWANETTISPKPFQIVSDRISCHHCPHFDYYDSIWDYIFEKHQKLNGKTESALDVGTGSSSLKFLINKFKPNRWTAITADPRFYSKLLKQFKSKMRTEDELLLGNWMNSSSLLELKNKTFDFILVDYVFAAMEYFSPFAQEQLVDRLKPHVKQYIYFSGQEPYRLHYDPSSIPSPFYNSTQGIARDIVLNIFKLRDSCQLLLGRRFYRFVTFFFPFNSFNLLFKENFLIHG